MADLEAKSQALISLEDHSKVAQQAQEALVSTLEDELQTKSRELEEAKSSAEASIRAQEEAISSLKGELQALSLKLEAAEAASVDAEKAREQLSLDLDALRAENDRRVQDLTAELHERSDSLRTVQSSLSHEQQTRQELEGSLVSAQDQLAAALAEKAVLQGRLDELAATLAQAESSSAIARSESSTEIASLRAELDAKVQALEDLQQAISAETAAKQDALASLESLKSELTSQNTTLQSEIDLKNLSLSSAESELAEERKAKAEMARLMETMRDELAEVTAELEARSRALQNAEASAAELRAAKDELENTLKNVQDVGSSPGHGRALSGTTAITSDQSSPTSLYLNLNGSKLSHRASQHFLHPYGTPGDAGSGGARSSKSTFEHYVSSSQQSLHGDASCASHDQSFASHEPLEPPHSPKAMSTVSKRKSGGIRQKVNSFVRRKSAVNHEQSDPAVVSFPTGDSEDSTSATSSSKHHGRDRVKSIISKFTPHKAHRHASSSSFQSFASNSAQSPPRSPTSPPHLTMSPPEITQLPDIPSGGRLL